ncbi:expressed protein [Arabidopsis lyrata subsp. lyrata]|uniref:Expressed protein n=1 Tax=Arabidopsis lyrata subsp. lyrata TaxID=81972 RepID=D7L5J8_ARALL|nr:expressed protein [Arabidopsis lyrata subsp. lyrata]
MESLAEEVDVKEILTLVASSSHKSLFNLSLVCKSLHNLCNDPQVNSRTRLPRRNKNRKR